MSFKVRHRASVPSGKGTHQGLLLRDSGHRRLPGRAIPPRGLPRYFRCSELKYINIIIFCWMIANEEYLFHITDLSMVLSNSFFWPTEVSLHQIVELVVVRREELSGWRGFIQLGSLDGEMISSLRQCSAGQKSGP